MDNLQVENYIKYNQCLWGDLIYGSEAELKALGLGICEVYPKSDRKALRILDPRGFKTTINLSSYMGPGIYSASISFPNRERLHWVNEWVWFNQGVELCRQNHWDVYKGDAKSLSAAGLVSQEFFPGQPGMGKVQVTLDAGGMRRSDTNGWRKREAGTKTIKKISRTHFLVSVNVTQDVSDIRCAADRLRDDDWEQRMLSLPRPAPLTAIASEEILSLRVNYAKKDKKFQSLISFLIQLNSNLSDDEN